MLSPFLLHGIHQYTDWILCLISTQPIASKGKSETSEDELVHCWSIFPAQRQSFPLGRSLCWNRLTRRQSSDSWLHVGVLQSVPLICSTSSHQCVLLSSADGISVDKVDVPELQSSQEEADTRMFLHARHAASNGAQTVLIRSPDTDVVVIGLWAASHSPCQLVMETGSGLNRKVFSLTSTAQSLGSAMCNALPGFHAFTGCDTTSSFARQ